jgi:hypothetical protein
MRSTLIASGIIAASLLAPAVAFAQTSAPPDNTGPSTAESNPPAHHAKSTNMKPGTTTGMSSRSASQARPGGQSVARKPPGS